MRRFSALNSNCRMQDEIVLISTFDMFKIGIGPSSSHTVGPMKAACEFVAELWSRGLTDQIRGITVELFGSLAATGKGHGTDRAVLLGLEGAKPDQIDPDTIDTRIDGIRMRKKIQLASGQEIGFVESENLIFRRGKILSAHPNGMLFSAYDGSGCLIASAPYFSVGGGFIVRGDADSAERTFKDREAPPYPFASAKELLALCEQTGLSIGELMLENEKTWRSEAEIRQKLLGIWKVMHACMERGCRTSGNLPGGLKVRRRAPDFFRQLNDPERPSSRFANLVELEWVNLFALAVSEENAAGGRVVTAPTNGAAGIIPAVLNYYHRFFPDADDEGIVRFLLTAAAIGILYKINASISGAEVGCQGEIGSASSMAAGALTEVVGGTPKQVENAAEIAMEHNLGLTCDPVGGLVQVPCIERNAMGAVKAINAAQIAMHGTGEHRVSLDKVIATMKQTGRDMKSKYKETSKGGLAVNVTEC
jgi:L-serine dehydratase